MPPRKSKDEGSPEAQPAVAPARRKRTAAAAATAAADAPKRRGRPPKAAGEGTSAKRTTPARPKPAARKPTGPETVDAEIVEAEPEEEGEISPEVFGIGDEAEAEVVAEDRRPVVAAAPLPIEVEDDEETEPSFALSRTDPLARYMQEVSRHPVLSREQEHELAVRYTQTGDLDAAYRLVASNLRLVVKIAYEYRRAAFNVLDLIQEGNVGLMNAVKKYDPFKGVKLSTYAAWWIRAYILRFVMDNWRMVKLGTTQAQRKLFFSLARTKRELEKLGGAEESQDAKRIAKKLRVKPGEVVEMTQRMEGRDLSLDAPMGDDGGNSHVDFVADGGEGQDSQLADAEEREIVTSRVEQALMRLDPRERFIIEKRVMSDKPMTLKELGQHFGFSRERARQLEIRAKDKLKHELVQLMEDIEPEGVGPIAASAGA